MSFPRRAAAIIAEELNRAELERGVAENEADEEEDSDYVSEQDEAIERSSKKLKSTGDSMSIVQGGRLTEFAKRRAHELFMEINKQIPAMDKRGQAREILIKMLQEEAEENPESIKFKRKRDESWLDPMLSKYVKMHSNERQINSFEIAKKVLETFGTTEVQEKVRFAGETIAVARKVDKQAVIEESQQVKSGLDEMIDGISKKRGITTVEKSSHDWEKYKEEQNLKGELKDASKAGFVEKQAFLNRVDERQFEKERAARERERAIREANAPKRTGD